VGSGLFPDDGSTMAELVKHADAAMYVDKAHARRAHEEQREAQPARAGRARAARGAARTGSPRPGARSKSPASWSPWNPVREQGGWGSCVLGAPARSYLAAM